MSALFGVSACLTIVLSVCLSVFLSVLSVCLSVCLSVLSVCLSVGPVCPLNRSVGRSHLMQMSLQGSQCLELLHTLLARKGELRPAPTAISQQEYYPFREVSATTMASVRCPGVARYRAFVFCGLCACHRVFHGLCAAYIMAGICSR